MKLITLAICLSILPICVTIISSFQWYPNSFCSSPPQPQPRRHLLAEEAYETEDGQNNAVTAPSLAATAAKYHQEVAATTSFLSWSQNVGVSFSEYWHDKPCITTSSTFAYCAASPFNASAGITSYSCGQRPTGRLHAAAVSYGHEHNTDRGTTITSYVLAFGGVNGGVLLDDMWVFVNGLVNGEQHISGQQRDTRDPTSGFNTSCEDPSESSCTSCNRWHQVRARAVPRSATLCKLQPRACSSLDPSADATLDTFGLTGHAATLMSLAPVATATTQGSVLSFGGLRQGYGLSAETWYLNKLPFPVLGATAPGYDALFPPTNSDVEWRCADIYGHGEDYPPEPNCATQMESTSTTNLTGPNGTIQSGRLLPVTQCSWIIAPTHYYDPKARMLHEFSTELHAILITIDRLELESLGRINKAGHCESYMAMWDSGTTSEGNGDTDSPSLPPLLVRGCNQEMLEASSFVSTTGQVSISIDYQEDCPHHAGVALSYRVVDVTSDTLFCKGGCSGRGKCQAGKCVCDHGRLGSHCERTCHRFEGCSDSGTKSTGTVDADMGGTAIMSAEVYPRPRQWHTLVSVHRKASAKEIKSSSISVTEVVTKEFSSRTKLFQCRNDSLKVSCVISLDSCCVGSTVTSVESSSPHNLPDEFTHLGIFADRHITNKTELFKCIERDANDGNLCTKLEKTTAIVQTRIVSTEGTTRQILFGGWSGSKALADLWVLDMMEPVAADLSTYLDCALSVDSHGNVSSTGESPIPQHYGMAGLDRAHFNRSSMQFTYIPCPSTANPSRPAFPITARRNRWTQLTTTTVSAAGPGKTTADNSNIIPAPRARFGHSAVLVKSKGEMSARMVIFGGTNGMQTFGDVHSLIVPSNHHTTTKGRTRVPLSWRKMTDVVKRNAGTWPPRRTEHAASVFSGASGSTYMAIYGGQNQGDVLNDLWLFELDFLTIAERLQNKTRGWICLSGGTENIGTYLTSSPRFPLDIWPSLAQFVASLGFNNRATLAERFPPRFGHIMTALETSAAIDSWNRGGQQGDLETSQAMLIFSGSSATEVISGKSHSRHGLIKDVDGGKDPMLFYVCPEANMVCAQPVFHGS